MLQGLNSKCVSRNKDKDKKSRYFQSRTVDCYTRERVKRKEKGNPPPPTTSLFIHFVYHPRTILHASKYHTNLHPWSYTPSLSFLSKQPRHIIRHRNTSSYVFIYIISVHFSSTPLPIPYVLLPFIPASTKWVTSFPLLPAPLCAYLGECDRSYIIVLRAVTESPS